MIWKFGRIPSGFWEKQENRKVFFDWLGFQLGYRSVDDWYNVTVEDFQDNKGGRLLQDHYSNSPSRALQVIYPEHDWMLWRFVKSPVAYLEKIHVDKKKQLLDWLGNTLSIRELDDWYRISLGHIRRFYNI